MAMGRRGSAAFAAWGPCPPSSCKARPGSHVGLVFATGHGTACACQRQRQGAPKELPFPHAAPLTRPPVQPYPTSTCLPHAQPLRYGRVSASGRQLARTSTLSPGGQYNAPSCSASLGDDSGSVSGEGRSITCALAVWGLASWLPLTKAVCLYNVVHAQINCIVCADALHRAPPGSPESGGEGAMRESVRRGVAPFRPSGCATMCAGVVLSVVWGFGPACALASIPYITYKLMVSHASWRAPAGLADQRGHQGAQCAVLHGCVACMGAAAKWGGGGEGRPKPGRGQGLGRSQEGEGKCAGRGGGGGCAPPDPPPCKPSCISRRTGY